MSVVLATAGYDHKIRFWEAPSGVCTRIIKFPDSQVNRLEITPDKQFIAAAGNPAIRLYEIESKISESTASQGQTAVLTLEHTGNVTSIGFQKDGRYLYSGSEDGTLKVWDLKDPNFSRSFDVGAAVTSVCLRSDRDELISGDANGYVKVWDLGGGNSCINSVKPASYDSNNSETMFPVQKDISFESQSETSSHSSDHEKNSEPPSKQKMTTEGTVPIQAVDISEDSRTLVAVSNHGTVYVWDPSSGKPSNEIASPSSPTTADNEPIIHSSWLRPITKFRAHSETPGTYCLHAKISPNCRYLCTTASDGTAKLWDTATWDLTSTLNQSKWVWDAAFCADSSYLVTSSSDHVARLWNLRTGDVVRQYHGHQSAVTCVALNDCSV